MKQSVLGIIIAFLILLGSFFLAILVLGTANALLKTNFSASALLLVAAFVLLVCWYYYRGSSPAQILVQKFLVCLITALLYTTAIIHTYNIERQNWYEALFFLLAGYGLMIPGFAAGYIVKGLGAENRVPPSLTGEEITKHA